MPLNILNVVQLGSKRVLDIDYDDFPVRFAFVEKCHDAKHFDLLDLTHISDLLTNLADIEGIVVTFGLGLRMGDGRIFPGLVCGQLSDHADFESEDIPGGMLHSSKYTHDGGNSSGHSANDLF